MSGQFPDPRAQARSRGHRTSTRSSVPPTGPPTSRTALAYRRTTRWRWRPPPRNPPPSPTPLNRLPASAPRHYPARHGAVQTRASDRAWARGPPHLPVVVTVARVPRCLRPGTPTHFLQHPYGVWRRAGALGSGVHDVETAVVKGERLRLSLLEFDVVDPAASHVARAFGKDILGGVDPGNPSRSHEPGKVARDRARAAADIEEVETRTELRDQVRGGVLRCPGTVGAKDAVVMPVGVQASAPSPRRGPARRPG